MEPEKSSQALQKISRGSMLWSRSSATAPMMATAGSRSPNGRQTGIGGRAE